MGSGDELRRVKGIGSEYCDLLCAAGVTSLGQLGRCDPDDLACALADANEQAIRSTRRRLVRRVPARAAVERWIAHAAALDVTSVT